MRRGALLGMLCAALTLLILFLFRDNFALGTTVAALAIIVAWFVLGHFI